MIIRGQLSEGLQDSNRGIQSEVQIAITDRAQSLTQEVHLVIEVEVVHSRRLHANPTTGHSEPLSLLSLRSRRRPTPPPAFKTGPRPAFAREPHSSSPTGIHFVNFAFVREPHSPSPTGLHFVVFGFCERASIPLPMVAFQFYDPTLQMDKKRD
ncbi:hypothetical protein AVEN_142884-1 [Araneus ventricosus]|uniref:Uncharacterized protein n=1 Tax=Araneus ventricosus TaxID=182803 RepID=A0A4Y2GXZ9_ARAVE|nr:hypothetical protein AVEN_252062-1 [Araneus ventricosus]GBM58648.1 hypothetical protein AVEN_260371-1 [Araneus ventricosus]GBM58719.1 hypothetical protein AVEN_84145-1 [Araneus ventricosus]GBM58733.1 hypothetical protein AVEN_142884-1 [Araneus ventricosus]